MTKLFALQGRIQNYAWGGTQYLADLLDRDLKGQRRQNIGWALM